jgi:hypothetical protein
MKVKILLFILILFIYNSNVDAATFINISKLNEFNSYHHLYDLNENFNVFLIKKNYNKVYFNDDGKFFIISF